MQSAKKVVQTELDAESYKMLREVVKKKGISIKDGVRQAVRDWTLRESDMNNDPFFDTSNVIEGRKVTDATRIDETLYRGKDKR
ncbi:MAG: hypothetical protein ACE5IO_09620 [Thermoplasmata archaeon]